MYGQDEAEQAQTSHTRMLTHCVSLACLLVTAWEAVL